MPAPQPVRYSVQRAAGPKWKTVYLDDTQTAADKVFRDMVRINPRGYFRLIRLDQNAERSDHATVAFDWKLIELYDPKKGGFVAGSGAATTADEAPTAKSAPTRQRPVDRSSRAPTRRDRARVPLGFYVTAVFLGVALATLVYLVYGPSMGWFR